MRSSASPSFPERLSAGTRLHLQVPLAGHGGRNRSGRNGVRVGSDRMERRADGRGRRGGRRLPPDRTEQAQGQRLPRSEGDRREAGRMELRQRRQDLPNRIQRQRQLRRTTFHGVLAAAGVQHRIDGRRSGGERLRAKSRRSSRRAYRSRRASPTTTIRNSTT